MHLSSGIFGPLELGFYNSTQIADWCENRYLDDKDDIRTRQTSVHEACHVAMLCNLGVYVYSVALIGYSRELQRQSRGQFTSFGSRGVTVFDRTSLLKLPHEDQMAAFYAGPIGEILFNLDTRDSKSLALADFKMMDEISAKHNLTDIPKVYERVRARVDAVLVPQMRYVQTVSRDLCKYRYIPGQLL